jgi:hypothetical protein
MLGCGAMARAFADRIAVCLMLFWTLSVSALPVAAGPATQGVTNEPCPPGAVVVEPGASIQAAVDRADEGAAFCLKNSVHRLQVIRPKRGQRFHGEGRTVLNGSRLLTTFSREGPYGWRVGKSSEAGDRKSYFIPTQTRDVVPQEGSLIEVGGDHQYWAQLNSILVDGFICEWTRAARPAVSAVVLARPERGLTVQLTKRYFTKIRPV